MLSSFLGDVDEGRKEEEKEEGEDDDDDDDVEVELPSNPLFIQFDSLRLGGGVGPTATTTSQALAPIVIHRPSILKVILMQSQATASPTHRGQNMDRISLSGVVLLWRNNEWVLHDGQEYHDPKQVEEEEEREGSVMETYPLPGGIIAVYNHTKNRWYVLPPPHSPAAKRDRALLSTTDNQGRGVINKEYDA